MKKLISSTRKWASDRRAASAVEFALLAPLLFLLLGIAFEVSRLLMVQRQFEASVVGIARHVARFPEYEIRARSYAVPVMKSIFPGYVENAFNLKVDSLVKEGGILKEVFPGNVIVGKNPGIDWHSVVVGSDYANDESVIFVSASYLYRPLFPIVSSLTYTMKKDAVILPAFGRKYPWNDGETDRSKYVF